MRSAYIYSLVLCLAGVSFGYAMDRPIGRKEMAQRMEAVIAEFETGAIRTEDEFIKRAYAIAPSIAQAAGMSDREEIIAKSIIYAKYHRDYAKKESVFLQNHAQSQQKELKRLCPYLFVVVPYDCTVIIKKQYENGVTDSGESHTLYAGKYTIQEAQKVISTAISNYTRDYSKRSDGRLNPDQVIECTLRYGKPHTCRHSSLIIRANDAWMEIERCMKNHLAMGLE